MPVTGSIVATPAGDADHAKVRPRITLPPASRATALKDCVRPRALSVAVAGETTTDVSTCCTESVAVPDAPAVVAVIVTEPGARPVVSPVPSTVAITGSDELHANVWPATVRPLPSSATALNCCGRPTAASAALAGLNTTDRTTCATEQVALPAIPFVPSPWSVVATIGPVLVPPVAVNSTVGPPVVRLFPKASLARSVSVVMAPERILVTDAVTSDAAVETAPARAVAPNVTAGSAPARASKLCGPAMLPSVTRVCA